ncbi:D-amino-acid transaminase [Phyllobacterium leguminum]|uniref:Probable branched-chain-amino-acid aminotransferase n=1 Tax=Phyllobacterium leguminum TaxID=314237 RepID=A0A318T2U6_9HYPH|nr:D-amino-acid transaminase [Phyllobacterium leguminum]PYE88261.1 D-alanine transaminase [Phyllobacterium leguminum]
MQRIVYVNGEWLPESEAKVSVFDRGFLFADAVYEVTAVIGGKLIDFPGHAARLKRSLGELKIPAPLDADSLLDIHRQIVMRNKLDEGLIYLQISRGPADRDFEFPKNPVPTITLFTQAKAILANPKAETGISVITMPDLRWDRRDIKTVQLLYPSIAKTEATHKGADDAWLVEDGYVTEGSSSNAYIVTNEGRLITRSLSTAILPGITRASVLDLARGAGIPVEERAFTPEEARQAAEAFSTSATGFVMPVTRIDGAPVGTGKPGAITERLRAAYIEDRLANAI